MVAKRQPKKRAYDNALRAEQAEGTRRRILTALYEEMKAQPGEEVSLAAVARRAKVSAPTLYRHFPTRKALFEAMVAQHEGERPAEGLRLATLPREVRRFYARMDDPADPMANMAAARGRGLFEVSREVTIPRRVALMTEMVERELPTLSKRDRARLVDLLVMLISSQTALGFRDYLGRSGAETADRVNWAVAALLAHARASAPEGDPR